MNWPYHTLTRVISIIYICQLLKSKTFMMESFASANLYMGQRIGVCVGGGGGGVGLDTW